MSKVAVIIPCYNEEKTVGKVVTDFKRELPDAEIYVYDNNSTDCTVIEANKAGANIRYEFKQGKGNVIKKAFRDIDADIYIIVDGDDTYPVNKVLEMCMYIREKQADMVIGDRLSTTYFSENKRQFHNFGNKLVRYCINKVFKSNIHDIMTGYRAFSRDFVKSFPILSAGFEVETEMTMHCLDKNMRVIEVPIEYKDRPSGSVSKLNTFKDGMKVIRTILRMWMQYKPFTFFGILGTISLILGGIAFTSVLEEFIRIGLVLRFPTLIVSCALIICALLLYSIGIILYNMNIKHRQLYELYLNTLKEK